MHSFTIDIYELLKISPCDGGLFSKYNIIFNSSSYCTWFMESIRKVMFMCFGDYEPWGTCNLDLVNFYYLDKGL